MASRRKAREALLKVFYLSESRGISIEEAFSEMDAIDTEIEQKTNEREDLPLEPFALGIDDQQKKFVLALAHTISEKKELFNEHIKAVLENWDFSRISRIDRYIMWIALAEMTSMLDIPLNVSFNEAIELAKKYSSSKSPRFVNGILDSVARNMVISKKVNSV